MIYCVETHLRILSKISFSLICYVFYKFLLKFKKGSQRLAVLLYGHKTGNKVKLASEVRIEGVNEPIKNQMFTY